MIFNVDIEIDWIHEEKGIDEEIQTRIINALTRRIEDDFTKSAGEKLAKTAESLIKAKTELLINTVMEKPVVVSKGWNEKEEYESVFKMVEEKITTLYEGKYKSSNTCKKDPLLSNIENYVNKTVNRMLQDLEKKIITTAEISAKKAVDESKLTTAIDILTNQD